ncbi:MAG TPA: DUF4129 domain-containing protein, partial [Cellvibrionaceae bacterium]|nr:DUF4129 domain-containing protein [Cellvibrionaceae bacterium]
RARWEQVIAITARTLEVLLWALALALILWLAFNYRKLLARFGTFSQEGKTPVSPQVVFGLDVRPASLPSNPAEAALQLCAAGDYRQGLALLYRATLVALIQQGLQLKPSHTEEDCLARANGGLNLPVAARDYLQLLTRTWQQLAYGHLPPSRDLAERLCRTWPNHWAIHSAINEAARG